MSHTSESGYSSNESQVRSRSNINIEKGIIHRDYKDENVLINPQTLEIKIIDFGCAIL